MRLIYRQGPPPLNRERTAFFNQQCWAHRTSTWMKSDTDLHDTKNNSKRIRDLNIRPKAVKFLEERPPLWSNGWDAMLPTQGAGVRWHTRWGHSAVHTQSRCSSTRETRMSSPSAAPLTATESPHSQQQIYRGRERKEDWLQPSSSRPLAAPGRSAPMSRHCPEPRAYELIQPCPLYRQSSFRYWLTGGRNSSYTNNGC